MKIIVENEKRVSDFIGTKVDFESDLLTLDNNKVKDFINKYYSYLISNKCEKLKEFYNLTHLLITHIYTNGDEYHKNDIIYSMNNVFKNTLYKTIDKPIFTTHILVISDYDNNSLFYLKERYNKEQNDFKNCCQIRYEMSTSKTKIKSKIEVIENEYNKYAFKDINKKEIKDIYLTTLNNLCILLNNGNLYLDNILYAKDVLTLWHQDSYNSYIIYKNNAIEPLTNEFPNCHLTKYKKVVYNNFMLATLNKKTVGLTTLVDKPDTCVMQTFLDVDDISCSNSMLFLIKDNKKIRIPSWYNTLIVLN